MPDFDYQLDNLYDSLVKGTSVLVIGPEFLIYEDKYSNLGQALVENLKMQKANRHFHFYDTKDDFFYFREPEAQNHNAVYRGIRRYLLGLNHDLLHEKIAQLPFPLIINLSPDLLLVNAFEKLKIAHEFRFFHKALNRDSKNAQNRYSNDIEFKVSPEFPLIYNLFGHIEHEESIVLSYRDLFDYLYNIFGRDNLPQDLRSLIEPKGTQSNVNLSKDWQSDTEKDFVFIGLGYNKWYTQLVLRLLHAHTDRDTRMQRYVLGIGMDKLIENMEDYINQEKGFFYMKNYFSLQAVECSPIDAINQLFNRCQREGKLRNLNNKTNFENNDNIILNENIMPVDLMLLELLSRNKIREVISTLLNYFRNNNILESLDAIIIASSNYEDYERHDKRGLYFNEERYVIRNRVVNAINQAISDVRNHQLGNIS